MSKRPRIDSSPRSPYWWDEDAARLQQAQIHHDAVPLAAYTDEQVRQAIAFTRLDLVLVVAYLSALNRQLSWLIKIAVAILVLVLGIGSELMWR
jgi:hypothetical protein